MTADQKILNSVYIYQYNDDCHITQMKGCNCLIYKSGYSSYYFYERNGEFADLDFKSGEWFVATKKGIVLKSSFLSKEEAEAWTLKVLSGLNDVSKQAKKNAKKKYVPDQLKTIRHTGSVFRKKSVTGDDYLKAFTFHGGEFGNWLNDNDRQYSLDYGYDAFYDLALALDIPSEAISMGGELSIAFGARGSGNAMAHYDPLRQVINLTKTKGAGSLAHEYGHAIDYSIGSKVNKNSKSLLQTYMFGSIPEVKKLVDTMLYSEVNGDERKKHFEKEFQKYKEICFKWITSELSDDVSQEIKDEAESIADDMCREKGISFDMVDGFTCPVLLDFLKSNSGTSKHKKTVIEACKAASYAASRMKCLENKSRLVTQTGIETQIPSFWVEELSRRIYTIVRYVSPKKVKMPFGKRIELLKYFRTAAVFQQPTDKKKTKAFKKQSKPGWLIWYLFDKKHYWLLYFLVTGKQRLSEK